MNKRLLGLSCSSAASATVVTGRAIDRHSPHLRDPHRSMPTAGSGSGSGSKDSSSAANRQQRCGKKKKKRSSTSTCTRSAEIKRLVSPASSSRFLLNSSRLLQSDDVPPPPFIDIFPGEETPAVQLAESSAAASSSSEIAAVVGMGTSSCRRDHDIDGVARSSSSSARKQQDQVVALRVSLHCKGCAGKVKKHIAKMEGVTSFDIDIAAKKVTVVGDVTPLGVLSSISKVKPAQFWPSPPRASASF